MDTHTNDDRFPVYFSDLAPDVTICLNSWLKEKGLTDSDIKKMVQKPIASVEVGYFGVMVDTWV